MTPMTDWQHERSVNPDGPQRCMFASLEAAQRSFESAGDRPIAVDRKVTPQLRYDRLF